MHEKTLLYSALGFTALAAIWGVVHAQKEPEKPSLAITPVSLVDAQRLASADIPIRLTASDGSGLRLQSLRAKAVVEDPLALTELHLTFENPENRVREGTFRITLPQGASLSRFAMKVNGIWQEGEVVEKQAARRAYEDFLHRKQDPALMEQGAGNEFTARVFPIPANGTKEIILAYSETIETGAPYTLPLKGLPQLGTLDIDVNAAGLRSAEGGRSTMTYGLHQQRFTPAQDFVVEGRQLPRSAGLRSGDIAIARVVPFATSRPEPIASAVVLVDTSASRGLGLGDQAKLVKSTLAKMPADTAVVVACFDQEVASIYEGKAGGFGDKEASAITARGALGASNFEEAIGWATEQAKRAKAKRVIFVGDGVATAGETDAQKLKEKVEKMRDAGVERMDAIALGGIRDDAFLRTVVRGVLDHDGVVLDGKLGADALARRLGEATSSGVPVKVEGASWSYPEKLDGLQAGDEVMVYAQLDSARPVKISIGTQTFSPDLRTSGRPLVERAWAQAKIQSLVENPTDDAATTKRKIISLSTTHRVISPHTAMLVLEQDSDYARFGIDRSANVDVLSIQDGRIAVLHEPRSWEEKQARFEQDRRRDVETKAKAEKGGRLGNRDETAAAPPPPAAAAPAVAATATAAASAAAPSPRPATATATAPSEAAEDREEARPDPMAAAPGGPRGGDGHGGEGLGAIGGAMAGGGGSTGAGRAARGLQDGFGDLDRAPPATEAPAAQGRAPAQDAPAAPALRRARPPAGGPAAPPSDVSGLLGQANAEGPNGQVRPNTLEVNGGLGHDEVQRVLRGATPRMRACYNQALRTTPGLAGRMNLRVVVDSLGEVKTVTVSDVTDAPMRTCVQGVVKALRFPATGTTDVAFSSSFDLVNGGSGRDGDLAQNGPANTPKALPYEGRFKIVMERLSHGDKDGALDEAKRWQIDQPGDIMAFVALGEAFEARGDLKSAARAYGSILELFSFRADSRRFAGERLERLDDPMAIKLAADSYGKAAEQRPDHPASHRLYAFTLLKAGQHEKAFEAMKKGASRSYPAGRFAGVDRILKEDLGLIAAAWAAAQPAKRAEIMSQLKAAGGVEESGPSLRFVLNWETDANDVDFHIYDGKNGHAYYGQKHLASGGDLYADVTTGYGPECFTIRGPQRTYPYTLQAHYYSRGPMGYGMGKLEVIDHDGKGHLTFQERPFVVMVDRAYVDLGTVEKGKPAVTASLK
ncbi:MAG: AgmX/PglI C-terminal domain-containing protein [Deltaproteobacteria bacterium]|nr:AgmX/PglI C-terminal domain-containing protein [Deltaproteobacteria bacterium]